MSLARALTRNAFQFSRARNNLRRLEIFWSIPVIRALYFSLDRYGLIPRPVSTICHAWPWRRVRRVVVNETPIYPI